MIIVVDVGLVVVVFWGAVPVVAVHEDRRRIACTFFPSSNLLAGWLNQQRRLSFVDPKHAAL